MIPQTVDGVPAEGGPNAADLRRTLLTIRGRGKGRSTRDDVTWEPDGTPAEETPKSVLRRCPISGTPVESSGRPAPAERWRAPKLACSHLPRTTHSHATLLLCGCTLRTFDKYLRTNSRLF
ncbi:unnamed protein product [Cylicocyclus nassatus]|uniref:Uncharacterized protein n=1 Tax=Cylicocyclus nassatus TaxID=53992 RepID=A0AA36DRB9_CYLNA|nr:unnamed protein product [Cylicocyclus nassatus]